MFNKLKDVFIKINYYYMELYNVPPAISIFINEITK